MAKTFHQKVVKIFSIRNTLKRIFMLFPEFTKNQNPTKSDQIRPNPTKSDQIRRNPTVGFGRGSTWGGPHRAPTLLSVGKTTITPRYQALYDGEKPLFDQNLASKSIKISKNFFCPRLCCWMSLNLFHSPRPVWGHKFGSSLYPSPRPIRRISATDAPWEFLEYFPKPIKPSITDIGFKQPQRLRGRLYPIHPSQMMEYRQGT